ncbi:hypothetical protein J6590_002993 [Homalodisca vitripennis]|nr:hypothetical protein J6590_002993 [Homalodisca vitripennis]
MSMCSRLTNITRQHIGRLRNEDKLRFLKIDVAECGVCACGVVGAALPHIGLAQGCCRATSSCPSRSHSRVSRHVRQIIVGKGGAAVSCVLWISCRPFTQRPSSSPTLGPHRAAGSRKPTYPASGRSPWDTLSHCVRYDIDVASRFHRCRRRIHVFIGGFRSYNKSTTFDGRGGDSIFDFARLGRVQLPSLSIRFLHSILFVSENLCNFQDIGTIYVKYSRGKQS